jgi:coronin-1B/1C/6
MYDIASTSKTANACQVHENEVARAFKTCNDSYVEPISFIVPRRSEDFQTDIYPPTVGTKPAMSAGDWFDGKTAIPPRISLKGRFDGGEADEVPAPAAKPEPAAPKPAAAAEPPAAKPTLPVPAAEARAATSDVEEDDEDDDEDDEDEPEPLLADRANAASAKRSLPSPTTQPPPRATPTSAAPPPATKPTPAPAPAAKPSSATPTTTTGLWSASREAPAEPKKSFAALAPEASATAAQAQDVIAQALNGMQLAQQQAATAAERDAELVLKMLAALSEQVRGLTSNVDTLVGAVRRVELEIESLHEERG